MHPESPYNRFTDRARTVMSLAKDEARMLRAARIGPEHILLGLLKEGAGVAAHVLKEQGIDLDALRREVRALTPRTDEGSAASASERDDLTPEAEQAFQHATDDAREMKHMYLGTEHLLVGVIFEQAGSAARVLVSIGKSPAKIRASVFEILGHDDRRHDMR